MIKNSTKLNEQFWKNKKVFVTGHTGFKGTWLTLILLNCGAIVSGLSLKPTENQNILFKSLKVQNRINHYEGDIRDRENLENCIATEKPEVIFHLAAQPLVRKSYVEPMLTWEVNTIGSINVIEAAKNKLENCILVMITTDKVYENNEWVFGYREIDALGGYDPYSSSKAAAELAINTWRVCFSKLENSYLKISSARSGNVIGGGDWAQDRIIPDTMRSLSMKKVLKIRNKLSTRPWQHVLEPLYGYLLLAQKMDENDHSSKFNSAFNFGPYNNSNKTVEELLEEIFKTWNGEWVELNGGTKMHEANKLYLSIDKSINLLGWEPRWDFQKTVKNTVNWYKSYYNNPKSIMDYCLRDINEFFGG